MIVACQGTYGERISQTLEGMGRIRPYVDRAVVIVDETVTEEQKQQLIDIGCEVYFVPWEDSMVKMRNEYLKRVQTNDLVIVSDPDEWFGPEFCKDVRKIIAKAEEDGAELLLISSHDITYWENGERGEHVSGFFKNLIFKKTPETEYVGVGRIKHVHENLKLSKDAKIVRLDPKYYYEHIKHENEIWERAARNVFMAGGGDNVGEFNLAWKPLRQICAGLGIDNWTEARDYLRKGNIDPRLLQWLVEHRFEGTNVDHEMMEFFTWYKWMHPKELEGIERVKNLSEADSSVVQEYVNRVFKEVLGAEANESDKQGIAKALLSGEIEQKNLPGILANYQQQIAQRQQQMPQQAQVKKGERIRLPVPVDVDVHITEELFLRALLKSDTFWRNIKPQMDIGKFIEKKVWDKVAFHRWFYKNQDRLTLTELSDYVTRRGVGSVALCIMGYSKVLPLILDSVTSITLVNESQGWYDRAVDEIHVQGDDFTKEDIEVLEKKGCQVHIEPWRENFSEYKNKAISHAQTHWVLICDHDEIPTKELAENLREIIRKSEGGEKYNIVQFDCIDVTVDDEGKEILSIPQGPSKQLLHVNVKNPYYGNPHIWLKKDYFVWRPAKVSYSYKHVKKKGDELIRAVRNVFLGGGGDSWREKNELWVELREITDELQIWSWKEFHKYLKKGDIDPRLKNLFERLYMKPWHDDELRSFKDYYYKLHSEEVKKIDDL